MNNFNRVGRVLTDIFWGRLIFCIFFMFVRLLGLTWILWHFGWCHGSLHIQVSTLHVCLFFWRKRLSGLDWKTGKRLINSEKWSTFVVFTKSLNLHTQNQLSIHDKSIPLRFCCILRKAEQQAQGWVQWQWPQSPVLSSSLIWHIITLTAKYTDKRDVTIRKTESLVRITLFESWFSDHFLDRRKGNKRIRAAFKNVLPWRLLRVRVSLIIYFYEDKQFLSHTFVKVTVSRILLNRGETDGCQMNWSLAFRVRQVTLVLIISLQLCIKIQEICIFKK